jgi:hypothetical protein
MGEHNIPKQDLAKIGPDQIFDLPGRDHGKGQDVGRLVLVSVITVERLHFGIVGQANVNLEKRVDRSKGLVWGCGNRSLDRR